MEVIRYLGLGALLVIGTSCAEATLGEEGSAVGDRSVDAGPEARNDAALGGDPCVCSAGECCDGCQLLPDTERCGVTPIATEFSCEDTTCGSDALSRGQFRYCDGVSNACGNGNLVWDDWGVLEDCTADALCSTDGSSAYCTTCDSGCAGDACTCSQGANVAPTAIASYNSGSTSPTYGPYNMNDGQGEASCGFAWFHDRAPDIGFVELTWSAPQEIWGINVDTVSNAAAPCLYTGNRTLASGSIEWWDGAAWVIDGVVTQQVDDWSYQFSAPVSTTKVRINQALGSPQANPVVFELSAFACSQ